MLTLTTEASSVAGSLSEEQEAADVLGLVSSVDILTDDVVLVGLAGMSPCLPTK